ncbi:hypothetical protein DRW41_08595 [Neobacillus piezotolerans]|uniref:Uncharacterized protein n=1 Tax=Neobacillus piezotolerans TaxID=2259171 RepID=A0A3D8GTU7_9BACI|nr:hypothetical protein [Neobacillus piezotolerans]RDU37865.1 hypothetical protein DRW41_08595 [Neobacillus piezotolerans]
MKKRALAIGIAGLAATVFFIFFLKKDVTYKEISLSENEINSMLANFPSSETPFTGIEEKGIKTEAFIVGQAGQRIEIVSIRKSDNVGVDIIYKMTDSTDLDSKRAVKKVSFMNALGKPVGFIKVD